MSLLKLLGSSSFLMANKEIVKATDLECAVLLSDLAGAYDYWKEKNLLQDGYFFRTQSEIEQNTTLSAKVQLRCLKVLISKGILKTKLKGAPPVKYFLIDEKAILAIISQTVEIDLSKREILNSTNGIIQDVQKGDFELAEMEILNSTKGRTNNNRVNNNKEIIIDNNNKEKINFSFLENDQQLISLNDKKELEKVNRANFVNDKQSEPAENAKYFFEVTQVLALLTDRSGVKFVIPKTKTGIEKYEPYKLIKERISDGAKLEDIFAVVEMKNQEWQGTPIYKNFVPSTLFRKSNFEKYLQQLQLTYNNKQQTNLNNQFRTKKDENFAHYFSQLRDVDFSA
jgi:uncharacterized phage protein (TIGR02220 family)